MLAAAAGCVAETRPPDCEDPAVTRELTLADDRLEPQGPAACRGQEVTLVVESEQEGVIHIHGYDEQAAEVAPGETLEFRFTADRAGQFPIELHVSGEPEGRSVGIFTVHER